MKNKVNIKDIARATGFSASTVSKVVNGYSDISEETKKVVMAYIEKIDYTPNSIARSLRTNEYKRIGLLFITRQSMHDYIGEYYFSLIQNIAMTAAENGYNLLFYTYCKEQYQDLKKVCSSQEIDGLIIAGSGEVERAVLDSPDSPIPVVVLNRPSPVEKYLSIRSDDEDGFFHICRHLISQGMKRIVYFGSSMDGTISDLRFKGYVRALSEAGIEIDESLVVRSGPSEKEIISQLDSLLDEQSEIEAITGYNDHYALKIMHHLKSRGIAIPEEIALTGYDDIHSSKNTTPSLSSVQQHLDVLSKTSVETVISLIQGRDFDSHEIVYPTSLSVRQSSLKKTD